MYQYVNIKCPFCCGKYLVRVDNLNSYSIKNKDGYFRKYQCHKCGENLYINSESESLLSDMDFNESDIKLSILVT